MIEDALSHRDFLRNVCQFFSILKKLVTTRPLKRKIHETSQGTIKIKVAWTKNKCLYIILDFLKPDVDLFKKIGMPVELVTGVHLFDLISHFKSFTEKHIVHIHLRM